MEKYISENTVCSVNKGLGNSNHYLDYQIDLPSIKFKKEDGSTGMEIKLNEIVDVWLETLEPEQQSKLELEEIANSEKRELEVLREQEQWDERFRKKNEVLNKQKQFLLDCILKVIKNRGLRINKQNVRVLIRECRDNPDFWEGHTGYNPCGILFTQKEWDEFIASINPYQHFLDDENANRSQSSRDYFTRYLRELREAPTYEWSESHLYSHTHLGNK